MTSRLTWTRALAVAAALLSTGCNGKADPASTELKPYTFHGLTIGLPSGEIKAKRVARAREGELTILHPAAHMGVIYLGWEAGETVTDDVMTQMLTAMMNSFMAGHPIKQEGPLPVTIDGKEGRTFVVASTRSDEAMHLTTWRCGERDFFLVSAVAGLTETLHNRLIASVKCDDTVALEALLTPVVQLPEGWAQIPTGTDLTLTNVDGDLIYYAESFSEELMTKKGARALVNGMVAASGAQGATPIQFDRVHVDGNSRMLATTTADVDGTPLQFLFSQVQCPALDSGFQIIGSSHTEVAPEFGKMRCPSSVTAPAAVYPHALALFSDRCDGGEGAACARLADLTNDADYPLILDPERSARAAAAACRQGQSDYCVDEQ